MQETSQDTSNDTVSKLTGQRSTVSELRAKVLTLEQALASMVAEFEWEKADIKQRAAVRTQASGVELDKLQKLLSIRDRELSRVKRIARSIVEQRSDMEILFHEALNHVKQEMLMHRCTSACIHSLSLLKIHKNTPTLHDVAYLIELLMDFCLIFIANDIVKQYHTSKSADFLEYQHDF